MGTHAPDGNSARKTGSKKEMTRGNQSFQKLIPFLYFLGLLIYLLLYIGMNTESHGGQQSWASLVAQRVKRLPTLRETRVRSLGREDPLEKEMVTHSSILAWRIPWMEKPGRLQSTGSQRVRHD